MELTLYYREQCHLCDAMRKALVVFTRKHPDISWLEIDIDRDTALIERYDIKVPVLCYGRHEICHFFFDEPAMVATLTLA